MSRAAAFLRARQQEVAIWWDDRKYRLRRGGEVTGLEHRTDELASLAAARWGERREAPFHVLYVGFPTNWEPQNLPSDPGLAGVVSTFWLRDAGLGDVEKGEPLRRDEVGPAVADHLRTLSRTRPVHLVVAYLSGAHVRADHVQAWAEAGVVTSAFNLDDRLYFAGPVRNGVRTGPVETAPAFDLSLTNVRRSLTKYAAVKARALFWPEAANPGHFRPLGLERTHDVSFLGGRYGPRGDLVEALGRRGISVLARGPGWPDGPVPTDGVPEVMNRGRVVLGFSGIGRSMSATCLKGRDFEAPMCGAAYLPSWNPELPLVYQVGEEVVPWRNLDELERSIHALLGDESRLARLRAAGQARARRDHTWASRIGTLSALLGHAWRPAAARHRD